MVSRKVVLIVLLFVLVLTLPNSSINDDGLPSLVEPNMGQEFQVSVDGDESSESILLFSETTDNDVMYYPDSIIDDTTKTSDSGTGDYVDAQVLDATYWEAQAIEESSFVHSDVNLQVEGFDYAFYGYSTSVAGLLQVKDDGASWTTMETVAIAGSSSWYNGSWYGDILASNTVTLGIYNTDSGTEHIDCDYLEINWHYMTLTDADNYAEGFEGVEDWSQEVSTAASDSFTSNNDILDFAVTFDDVGNEYSIYATDITLVIPEDGYIEFRYKIDDESAVNGYFRFHDGVNLIGLSGELDSEDWETLKYLESDITDPDYDVEEPLYIWLYLDDAPAATDSGTYHMWFDYIRVSSTDTAGWQHDGSIIEGFVPQNEYCVLTTDGDLLNFSADGSVAYWDIPFDKTSTLANIDPDYYPMVKYSFTASSSGIREWTIRWYYGGGHYYGAYVDDTLGVSYENILAGTGGSNDRYKMRLWCDADEWFILDYIKFYSIADFAVTQSGVGTDDYLYVDSDILYSNIDDGYIEADYDIVLAVDGASYPIYNLTTSGTVPEFSYYVSGWSSYSDETRGAVSGVLTDIKLKFDSTEIISEIKFIEDFTAPVVVEFWNTPYSPSAIDNVTLSLYATDALDVYSVVYNAIESPVGFSDVNYDAIENSEQDGFFTYTFNEVNLPSGFYAFMAIISDGANTVEHITGFRVGEQVLQVTDVVLITTGSTDVQLSGRINMDTNYVIYENVGSGDVQQGTGSVDEGWFSISWTKESVAGLDVGLGVVFTVSTYTEWVNGSYSVATAEVLYVTDTVYSSSDSYNYLGGYLNLDSVTWTAYDNGSQKNTGSLNTGSFSINWVKVFDGGLHEWSVKFTDGTTIRWVNGSYESDGFVITEPYVTQNNVSVIMGGKFYVDDLTVDYSIYEDGVYSTGGTLSIPSSGSYYAFTWTKDSGSTANWTIEFMSGGENVTFYGYNMILEGSDYHTYLSSGLFEGDTVYIDADAAVRAAEEMWDTLGLLLLILIMPVVVGLAVRTDRAGRVPRGKRDKGLDKIR